MSLVNGLRSQTARKLNALADLVLMFFEKVVVIPRGVENLRVAYSRAAGSALSLKLRSGAECIRGTLSYDSYPEPGPRNCYPERRLGIGVRKTKLFSHRIRYILYIETSHANSGTFYNNPYNWCQLILFAAAHFTVFWLCSAIEILRSRAPEHRAMQKLRNREG